MADDEELQASETTGYKVGDKKTLEELQSLDANDESLQKWKASLGLKGSGSAGPASDPRKVIVLAMSLQVEGRPDVIMDLSNVGKSLILIDSIENVEKQYFVIKEGVEYRLCIRFIVQHDVVSGLKYLHIVKRSGIKVDKMEEMLGSYGPSAEPYEKKFLPEEAPSGMIARGKYNIKSKFVDDDKVTHLEWSWGLEIRKDWE